MRWRLAKKALQAGGLRRPSWTAISTAQADKFYMQLRLVGRPTSARDRRRRRRYRVMLQCECGRIYDAARRSTCPACGREEIPF